FPHNCIIDSLSQSFLVELLPYLMQLLFDSLKFLAINFSVACICSLCQLIDVITNRSQLLCYLNRPPIYQPWGASCDTPVPAFSQKLAHSYENCSLFAPILHIRGRSHEI